MYIDLVYSNIIHTLSITPKSSFKSVYGAKPDMPGYANFSSMRDFLRKSNTEFRVAGVYNYILE